MAGGLTATLPVLCVRGRCARRQSRDVDYGSQWCSHSRGYARKRLQTSSRTASKQTSFQRQKQPRGQWGDHDWASLTSYRPSAHPVPSPWSIPRTGRPRAQRSGPASSVDALAMLFSDPSRCWAQFVELGFGAIQRRFLGAFHYVLACVGQRGSRSRQTGAMVYRMGRPMEGCRPWIWNGSIWDRR